MQYPIAKRQPTAVNFGRVSYTDDFQWLEEDSAEALDFQAAQDRFTQDWLKQIPNRERAEALMATMPRVESDFLVHSAGRWFRKRTPEGNNLQVIEVADACDGPWRIIVDLNALSTGEPLSIDNFAPSPDGRKLLFGWGVGGRELAELRIIEVDSGNMLLESIRQLRPFFAAWLPDSSGVYYTAWDPAVSMYQSRVFLQKLGAAPVTEPESHEISHSMMWAKAASDRRHTLIIADHLNPRPEYIRDETVGGGWLPFLKGETALFRGDIIGDRYYAITSDGAPCGRLVSIPLATPSDRSSWKELVPGSNDVLGTLLVVDGLLVLADLVDTWSRIRVFDTEGRLKGEIALPGKGSVSTQQFAMFNMLDMISKGAGGEILFPFSSPSQSSSLYKANVHTLKVEALTQPQVRIDARIHDYAATSADGARVPYHVIARPDIDPSKPHPTIMYGYGGFQASLIPGWSGVYLAAWVKAGGVLVLMHLRGGGELGPDMWHQGRLRHKQNSFNDVYAIAEDLIARGISSAAQLGVAGGSNGGVMAAVVTVQRPELFGAAVSQVPITDALGRARDEICMASTLDYGDPNDAEMSEVLRAWSPYQNVKDGTAYPALLLDAGANDSRCPPWHVRKMAARLQPASASANPILMRVREGAGHGSSGAQNQRMEQTDWVAFFAHQLGLAL